MSQNTVFCIRVRSGGWWLADPVLGILSWLALNSTNTVGFLTTSIDQCRDDGLTVHQKLQHTTPSTLLCHHECTRDASSTTVTTTTIGLIIHFSYMTSSFVVVGGLFLLLWLLMMMTVRTCHKCHGCHRPPPPLESALLRVLRTRTTGTSTVKNSVSTPPTIQYTMARNGPHGTSPGCCCNDSRCTGPIVRDQGAT